MTPHTLGYVHLKKGIISKKDALELLRSISFLSDYRGITMCNKSINYLDITV